MVFCQRFWIFLGGIRLLTNGELTYIKTKEVESWFLFSHAVQSVARSNLVAPILKQTTARNPCGKRIKKFTIKPLAIILKAYFFL
ncbi:MAG TPA: hypothetical protein DDW76_06090 [Cyanobacteria bacterium UBA11369]|nr:hypothetical protein [Cyanobacteria bacterium UBA11369]